MTRRDWRRKHLAHAPWTTRETNSVKALCHPERPHRAKGLCEACYHRARKALHGIAGALAMFLAAFSLWALALVW